MQRQRIVLVLMVLAMLGGLAEAKRPNIVLVMADDQGWGDTGYTGHPFVQTPALDAMASEGFVFDRFYAAAPVCSPTRASVLTGRHPIRAKVPNHGRYMRSQENTLAEALQAAGYVTGIFGKVHLGSGQPNSPANPSAMGFDEWVVGLNFFDNDPYLSRNGKVEQFQGKGSVVLMDEALAFLEKHKQGDRPMFTVVWFPSPHDPHQEVPEGPSLYDGKAHAGYYREITLLDQQVGRLRSELSRMGLAENTILWYCSDNGGLVEASSGGRAKKGSIYEGGLRVPSIVQWPARHLKGRTAVPVTTCDMYPTLLAMAGVTASNPHPLDGIDVTDIMAGTVEKRSKPMGFWHQFQGGQATWSDRLLKDIMEKQQAGKPTPHNPARMRKDIDEFPQFAEDTVKGHAAWNDWPWKLHRFNEGKTYELYNLEDDPMETNNLVEKPELQARLKTMQQSLDTWMRSVVRSINGRDYQEDVSPVQDDPYPPQNELIKSPGHTTYYVHPAQGNNSNDGKSENKAWKNLTKVNTLMLSPGDRIDIAPGKHNGSLKPSGAGTAGKPVVFVFAPGVHEFSAGNAIYHPLFVSNANDNPTLPRPIGIMFQDVKHFRITGGPETKILFVDRMVEFFNDHCEDVTYSNLTFDLKRPTVSEFRVIEVEPNSVVIQVAEGSNYAINHGAFSWVGDIGPGWTMAQQADLGNAHSWRMGRWNPFSVAKAEALGSQRVRLTYKRGHMNMEAGRQFQFRNTTRDTVSACNNRCSHITIRDCTFHALTGMGIVSQFTDGITVQNVDVVPPSNTIRTCPAWADVFHFSGCRGEILVDSCHFSGTQDDPINVHGTHLRIIGKVAENQLLLRFMHPQTYGFSAFLPGDEIAVINHASLCERKGTRRRVTAIERQTDKEWLLTLEGSAPDYEKNDVVDNITWYPNVTIRNCLIEMTSCRGFLITTRGRVLVENNTFIRTHMAAILVEDDAEGWFESGPIRDMTIRGNRFIQCGQNGSPAIWINPHNSTAKPGEPVHENIRIENNVFDTCGISARSVGDLTLVNNRSASGKVAVTTQNCTSVKFD